MINEDEIKYNVIKDPLNIADIHKGSGGNFLYLYFTTDTRAGKPIKSLKILTSNQSLNQPKNVENSTLNNTQEKGDVGYVKELFTDQQIYTSGVIYRYVNNIDPNKDLICDSAKYDGPLNIVTVPDYPK